MNAVSNNFRGVNKHLLPVKDRLVADGTITPTEWPTIRREFLRYMKLVGKSRLPLAMIGPKIDSVWHQFILFTCQYRQFCDHHFGYFIDHQPNSNTTPVPSSALSNFIKEYEKEFGALPSIWLEGLDARQKHAAQNLILAVRINATLPILKLRELDLTKVLKWSGWAPANSSADADGTNAANFEN